MQAVQVRPGIQPPPTAAAALARRAPHVGRAVSVGRQALPSVSTALRAVESLLLSAGQRTARRNAWSAVLEDRSRAQDRAEALQVMEPASPLSS